MASSTIATRDEEGRQPLLGSLKALPSFGPWLDVSESVDAVEALQGHEARTCREEVAALARARWGENT